MFSIVQKKQVPLQTVLKVRIAYTAMTLLEHSQYKLESDLSPIDHNFIQ